MLIIICTSWNTGIPGWYLHSVILPGYTSLHPLFLHGSPSFTITSSPVFSGGGIFATACFKEAATVGESLTRGVSMDGLAMGACIGGLTSITSSGELSLFRFPVIFSGSTGFTLLCLPRVQPGVFRKVVKSVDLFWQHVQPLYASWKYGAPNNILLHKQIQQNYTWVESAGLITIFSYFEFFSTASIIAQLDRHCQSVIYLKQLTSLESCKVLHNEDHQDGHNSGHCIPLHHLHSLY